MEFLRESSERAKAGQGPAVVGRATCTLKLVGDYLTKFEGPADGIPGGPKKATGEMHVLPPEDPNFKWRVRVDVRAAENIPLNDVVAQGLPSTFLEFGWSLSSLSAAAGSSLLASNETEQTVMVDKTVNPNWNQQILFHNPRNVLDYRSGYFVIQIKDFYREGLIDQLNIPMRAMQPYYPVHLEIQAPHRENSSQTYKLFLSVVLEVPQSTLNDRVVAVVVNSARFDPPNVSNVSAFSFMLGNNDFSPGRAPYLPVNPRGTEAEVERFFALAQEMVIFQSPWQPIPPAIMDSQYNGLAVFLVPHSFL